MARSKKGENDDAKRDDNTEQVVDKSEAREESARISKADTRKKPDTVTLVSKLNRSFDLHADRVYHFNAAEEKIVPKSVLDTEGFKRAAGHFVVRE